MSKILFLLSHQPNPRFIKQINFLSVNNEISVLYYFRDYMKDLSTEYSYNVIFNSSMGSISNGNYLKRIYDYFKSFRQLRKILKKNKYDTLIVNNIDTLALFKLNSIFKKKQTQVIIEISDLISHAYTNSIKSKVMKNIDKFMFKFVDKLIVTSPKFYDIYYNKIFKRKYFLLENKPLSTMIPLKIDKKNNEKVIIGIVGLLLEDQPNKTLFKTVKNDKRYEVHIYGKGVFQKFVEEYANKYENIKYFGEYNFFKDSARIYSSLDILYMPYDTTTGFLNNKVALPNKLYEAMYFQVPIITSSGTYLGEIVDKYGLGTTLKCCDGEILNTVIENISMNKKIFLKNFKELETNLYLADNDYILLENFIMK